jgi:circadian clock protein KaiB
MSSTNKPAVEVTSGSGGLDAPAEPSNPAAAPADQRYVLRLYVTGATPASSRAIAQARELCEEHLANRYTLEVIDIYQLPALARDDKILATPTLIMALPLPLRRYIGDLSKLENVLFGLDLRPAP